MIIDFSVLLCNLSKANQIILTVSLPIGLFINYQSDDDCRSGLCEWEPGESPHADITDLGLGNHEEDSDPGEHKTQTSFSSSSHQRPAHI